jgi:hypothetical protein
MTYVVLTLDQRDSRTSADLVPDLLELLNDKAHGPLSRRFERTAGDEVQGVLADASATLARLAQLVRSGSWNIGIGIGPVEEPLPRSTRAGRGDAFLLARQAINKAKQSPARLNVVGADAYRAEQLETVLWLWAGLLGRRSERGWEVADLLDQGLSYAEAATRLGITQPAVSQRAHVAGLVEARRAAKLAGQLLGTMLTGKEDR